MSDGALRVALDTSILVYAEGMAPLPPDAHKPAVARAMLAGPAPAQVLVPAQALGELFRVLVGKGGRSRTAARLAIISWRDSFAVAATTETTMLAAVDLATDHAMSIWDAVILSAAVDAGCRLLLSEDMQDGFTCRGLTVVDPFAAERHPLLTAILGASPAGPVQNA